MERNQSTENWQKSKPKLGNGNRNEKTTIVRHQAEGLDNLIKFKKDKELSNSLSFFDI